MNKYYHNIKTILFAVMASTFTLSGCQQEISLDNKKENTLDEVSEEGIISNVVRIKFNRELAKTVEETRTGGGVNTGLSRVDQLTQELKVDRIVPVFNVGGKFEERQRKAGLHLWYDVYYKSETATRTAINYFKEIDDIEVVEPLYKMRLNEHRFNGAVTAKSTMKSSDNVLRPELEELPFNDPRLEEQWHYYNMGESVNGLIGAVEGADINLYKAWEEEKGSPNVVVAIMDGGIKYDHPDLRANMWVNEAEKNGLPGVDDDNNGYIDDVYGYNFVTNKGEITQHMHGTHVGGTVSAVNGNGVGVCGIAGGTGKGDGVRLMSCQIFHMNASTGKEEANANYNMYVYAADNGAVISQNSWTNGPMPDANFEGSSLRTAIDYFIENAGKDINGNQTGPMSGGIVIFASANRNSDIKDYPAAYEPIFTVSAMSHNFKKSSYSNFGDWVDITAPGGEQSFGDKYAVLSTTVDNGYVWAQGTSMASPHVAGCAALLVSKFQGPGYTNMDLEERMRSTSGNIDLYNPDFEGEMGVGYIDIGTALTPATTEKPAVTPLKLIDAYDDWAIVEWAIQAAADGPMSYYDLKWSRKPIAESAPEEIFSKRISVRFMEEGKVLQEKIDGLSQNVNYYFVLSGTDKWGNRSENSAEVVATPVKNEAPVIRSLTEGYILVDEGTTYKFPLEVSDKEKQKITFHVTPEVDWVNVVVGEGDKVDFVVNPGYTEQGKHEFTISAIDEYNAKGSVEVSFEVNDNMIAPKLVKPFPDMTLKAKGKTELIDLLEYFDELSGGALMFEIENTNSGVASAQRLGNKLSITPISAGNCYVSVRAINGQNFSTSASIKVEVTGTTNDKLTVFPNPVIDVMNIRLAKDIQGEVTVRIFNSVGREVINRRVEIIENGYQLSLGNLSGGTYSVVVEKAGEEYRKNIIKL